MNTEEVSHLENNEELEGNFPDPKNFRTGTIPPDCPLVNKNNYEDNKQDNTQSI